MIKYLNRQLILSIGSLFVAITSGEATAGFLPVCERTEAIKQNLTVQTKKACEAITPEDLLSIKRVAVNGKNISQFKAEDFSGLRNMEILNIRSNPYTELPEGLFNDLSSLNTLVIIGTQLSRYPEDFLEATPLMKQLILFRNAATTLPEAVLDRLENLRNLEFVEMDRKLEPAVQQRLNEIFPSGGPVNFRFK